MNKNGWIALISIWVAVSLAGCTSLAAPAPTSASPKNDIKSPASGPYSKKLPSLQDVSGLAQFSQVEETGHCLIYYPEGDQIGASYIGAVLEDQLARLSADLGHSPVEKVKVFVFPDLDSFHQAIGLPNAPDWVIATGYVDGIQMVTPRLISSDLLEKTLVHELTHTLQGQVNPNAPFWMIEGLAMYESGMDEGVRETVREHLQANDILPLASLETLTDEGFEQAGGYALGYTVVEYVIQAYGKDVIKAWIKTPSDFQRVFGVSADTFEQRWRDYLVKSYSSAKLV